MIASARRFLSLISTHPLASQHRMRAITNVLRLQATFRLGREALVPFVGSSKLLMDRGMTGLTGNAYLGLHEADTMAFCLHVLAPDDLFADIGANAGSYSILASAVAGSNVVAVEPDRAAIRALRRNLSVNDVEAICEVCECIADSRNTQRRFTIGMDTINHVVDEHSGEAPGETELLQSRRVDEMLGYRPPTIAKIDVEGYEHAALSGFGGLLGSPALLAIIVEISADRNDADGSSPATRLLEREGFLPYEYDPIERSLTRLAPILPPGNLIFVRDIQTVSDRIARAPRFMVHPLKMPI